MNNILEQIALVKQKELAHKKMLYPVKLLEQSLYFDSPVVSLKKYLSRPDKAGIIAEFKRKSPTKGVINGYANIEKVSVGYMQAGAAALSVLTDTSFFGGKNEDLSTARKFNYCPILRKDFILDEYQIIEARAIGADAVLLIAALLSPAEIKRLAAFAQSLQLEVLLELHQKEELPALNDHIDVVGINNRNLKTFQTDINHSLALLSALPADCIKISESGIQTAAAAAKLLKEGFDGLLLGTCFMQHSRPEMACAGFIKELKGLLHEN